MLNFLLDITPDKSQLLITIKLAGILREKKQEVYYTYTSNPAFTPVLYNKGISNCVLYPDDFRWLKPDLTLLDCRHAAHASLYRDKRNSPDPLSHTKFYEFGKSPSKMVGNI